MINSPRTFDSHFDRERINEAKRLESTPIDQKVLFNSEQVVLNPRNMGLSNNESNEKYVMDSMSNNTGSKNGHYDPNNLATMSPLQRPLLMHEYATSMHINTTSDPDDQVRIEGESLGKSDNGSSNFNSNINQIKRSSDQLKMFEGIRISESDVKRHTPSTTVLKGSETVSSKARRLENTVDSRIYSTKTKIDANLYTSSRKTPDIYQRLHQ